MSRRILLATAMGGLGGTETHLLQLARHIDRTRFTPLFVTPPGRLAVALRAFDVEVDEIEMAPFPWAIPRAARAIAAIIARRQPDLLHAHTTVAGIVARPAAFRLRVPSIFTHHGFAYRDMMRLTDPPLLRRFRLAVMIRLEYWLDARTDYIVSVSENDLRVAFDRRFLPHYRADAILNGIEPLPAIDPEERRRRRAELKLGDAHLVVGTLARMVPQKALPQLVEAFAGLSAGNAGARLLIAGEGPDREAVSRTVRHYRLEDKVLLLGEIAGPRMLMPCLDIFALSSLWEGCPYALLEAMAAGVPIVATAVNGIPELLSPETGILVPPGDVHAMTAALCNLAASPDRRQAFGGAARERCLSRFSAIRSVRRLEHLYENVLGVR